MKELSLEQKAKAYDELIDKITDAVEAGTIKQGFAEWLFPALAESENERIRKAIIALIEWSKSYRSTGITNDDAKKMIAWLEKQSQENMVEALRLEYEKGKADTLQEQRKEWTTEDLLNINEIADILQEYNRDDLIDWLENQYKEKSTRNDEDEHRINDTIYFLETAKKHYASTVELDACIDWLKFLKNRYIWKPSYEQMEALWCATEKYLESDNDNVVKLRGNVLESLYNELKKLKLRGE